MTQAQALAILDSGESVLLTGPAGSGKTYVLNSFVREARGTGKHVAVTASTGLAATHLGGSTIHMWSGIGIHDEYKKFMVTDMSKSRRDQILQADILIIDEVSMLHDYRLDMIDEICRQVRGEAVPFGGLQVVLCGDFFQLPPVNRQDGREGGFIISSSAWRDLDPVICYLEEQHRQQDDEALLDILTALRSNDLRRRHAEALLTRKMVRTPFDEPVTELYTRNVDVDEINQVKLEAMVGDTHEFLMVTTGKAKAVESLKKSCLAPEVLQLKIGALVMFVKNSLEKKYVNGTLGTIVGFEDLTTYPIVQTKTGKEIIARPDTWELRDGEKKLASLSQIPLRLAWAITVHKSQGMTLDAAHMDLSKAFVPGMGYVALSRVRSLNSLSLSGINKMALLMHPDAYEIDAMLRKKSEVDIGRLAHLEASYVAKKATQKEAKKPIKDKKSWAEKLVIMRAQYPNAYKTWQALEDATLLASWEKGSSLKQMSQLLGRHEGSIRARLKKHLGETIDI